MSILSRSQKDNELEHIPTQATTYTLTAEISKSIRIVRVICIFFMMYVHVNPGNSIQPDGLLGALKLVLTDLLGRASVSALSLISGLLIVCEFSRKTYQHAITSRVRTLVLPLFTWNVLIILFSAGIYITMEQKTSVMRDLQDVSAWQLMFEKALPLTANGATTALNFLRDIFMCALLSPALIYILKKTGAWSLAAVAAIAIFYNFEPIVFRGSILLFYMLGLYIAVKQVAIQFTRKKLFIAIGILLPIIFLNWYADFELLESNLYIANTLNLVKRLCLAYCVLHFAHSIYTHNPTVSSWFFRIEPRIYFIFLGHTLFFLIVWGVWQLFFGKSLAFPYILFYLFMPPVWVLLSRYAFDIISAAPPSVRYALKGK